MIILFLLGMASLSLASDEQDIQKTPDMVRGQHTDNELNLDNSGPDLSAQDLRILKRGEISKERYIAGGLLGIYPGFGIGQLVQGRYSEAAISAGIQLGSVGVGMAAGTIACGGLKSPNSNCTNLVTNLVIAVFVSGKIWEIYDSWVGPPRENKRYKELVERPTSKIEFSPHLVPTKEGGLAGFSISF